MEGGIGLKISIDGQLFLKGEKTGIGWFAHNILKNLSFHEKEYQLNCFTLGYGKKRRVNVEQYKEYGYKIHKISWFNDVFYRIVSSCIPLPYRFFFGSKTKVSLFFNYIIPPGVSGSKIVVIHDMTYKRYPETVRFRTRKNLELLLSKTCKRADTIITISQFSKSEIMKYLNVPEEKIKIISLGVDTKYYNNNYTGDNIKKIQKKYNVDYEYFLYLGTIEPRKNIERLIRAYAVLYNQKNDIPKLVLVGKKGWMYKEIFRVVDELDLQNMVIFLGYIDICDVPLLLGGAITFVFPSLYEGFGLPVLEAMACGTPVITSNVASLPEVVGNAALLVDPMDIESIKNAMLKILIDPCLKEQLSVLGIQQAKKFSWKETARQIEKIIDEYR